MTSHLRTGHMQTLQALEADFLNDFPGPDLRLWILPEHSDFIRLSGGRTGSSGEICLWDADASEWTWRGFEVATTVEDKPEALAWFADFSSKTILHLISSPHDPRRVATWKQLLAGSAPGEYDV